MAKLTDQQKIEFLEASLEAACITMSGAAESYKSSIITEHVESIQRCLKLIREN